MVKKKHWMTNSEYEESREVKFVAKRIGDFIEAKIYDDAYFSMAGLEKVEVGCGYIDDSGIMLMIEDGRGKSKGDIVKFKFN